MTGRPPNVLKETVAGSVSPAAVSPRRFFRPIYERAAEGFADELRARVARAFAVPAHMLAERPACGFCGRRYVEQPVAACDATTAGQCLRRQIRSE